MSTVNETQRTSKTSRERKSRRSLRISLDAQAGAVTEKGQHCHACIFAIVGRYLHGRVDAGNGYIAAESPSAAFFIARLLSITFTKKER